MTLTLKLAACAALVLFTIPATSAFAKDPVDVGQQQTECIANGGTLTVGDGPKTYDCNYEDSTWTCDFSGATPDCDEELDPMEVDTNPFDDGDAGGDD